MRGSFSYWTLVKTGHIITTKPIAMATINLINHHHRMGANLHTDRYTVEFGSIQCASDAGREFSYDNAHNH